MPISKEHFQFSRVISELSTEVFELDNIGAIPDYINELSHISPNKLGLHLITVNGKHFSLGDHQEAFSIQSIAKVFSLVLAFKFEGEQLWQRVGVEPSGGAFNSLVQLEVEQGIPRNPFINAGALVICDVLVTHYAEPIQAILQLIHELTGNTSIQYSVKVAQSELSTSFRNSAMLNFMKSFDNIVNDVDQVLDVYCCLCAIEMTCQELAQAFLFLANNGINPLTQQRVVTSSQSKRLNAILLLCGFYDEAGDFAFKVGLPGKSGVGGGIVAIHPRHYCVSVWSPKLNAKGNSYRGMKILESLTSKIEYSIF